MIKTIQEHIAKYPLMQIQDVAKLMFQSEFGGGHMIADEQRSLKRIQEEYQTVLEQGWNYENAMEPIGNGMCRMYLNCLNQGLKAEVLNQMFVISANNKIGSIVALEEKIETFLNACKNQTFAFSYTEATIFMEAWKEKGYPAMSHSDVYREAYHPAYRVMEMGLAKVFEVIRSIEGRDKESYVVAIDGMCGSGKSTLGNLLKQNYPEANLFHVDDYFLQPHQRTEERLAEIGGNVDYERFKLEIVDNLQNPEGIIYQPFSCQKWCLDEKKFAPWKPLVIIEGAYGLHPYFGEYYDLAVFSEITPEEQIERIRKRNGEEMLKRFVNEWIVMENQYFDTFKIREKTRAR